MSTDLTGCSFNGRQYVDGSEFTLDTDPCMTCLCHNTVMTCEQKKCFSVCDNPVSVPGQCCPVCPSKSHKITYHIIQWFDRCLLNSDNNVFY